MNLDTMRTRWKRLWNSLQLSGDADLWFNQVCARYAQAHRQYHTLKHIEACLHHFDAVRPYLCDPVPVELALWLHDVVYEPLRKDNEEKSADFAHQFLSMVGGSTEVSTRVQELILLTKTHVVDDDQDARTLIDIDLSILGASEEVFDQFEAAIRFEYQMIPLAWYQSHRVRVLARFLAQEQIYHTDLFRAREAPARANLRRAIKALEA